MSPCARSLEKLRGEGWTCGITEHFNKFAKVRQDLYGFIDILAFQGAVTMAVQTTSGDNVSHRLEKILSNPIAKLWCEGGFRILVIHGWRKVGARGKRKLWECREVNVEFV